MLKIWEICPILPTDSRAFVGRTTDFITHQFDLQIIHRLRQIVAKTQKNTPFFKKIQK